MDARSATSTPAEQAVEYAGSECDTESHAETEHRAGECQGSIGEDEKEEPTRCQNLDRHEGSKLEFPMVVSRNHVKDENLGYTNQRQEQAENVGRNAKIARDLSEKCTDRPGAEEPSEVRAPGDRQKLSCVGLMLWLTGRGFISILITYFQKDEDNGNEPYQRGNEYGRRSGAKAVKRPSG